MTTPGKKLTRRCHSILFKINPYLCRNQSGNQNQYQQSQDGIQFREHGQYHRSTEHVITATDCHDTVSTYLSLTDSREESYQAKSQSGTEMAEAGPQPISTFVKKLLNKKYPTKPYNP